MPKLNTANQKYKIMFIRYCPYWVKEFDIDGWRLDVANEVDHHFLEEIQRSGHYDQT